MNSQVEKQAAPLSDSDRAAIDALIKALPDRLEVGVAALFAVWMKYSNNRNGAGTEQK